MSDFSTVKPAFRLGPSQQIASGTTVVGYQEVNPKVVPGFNQPIKTHQVWASILWPFETTNTNISVNHSGLMVFDPLQIILSSDGFSLSYIDLTVAAGALIAYTLGLSPITTLYTPGSAGQNMTLHGSDPNGLWEGFFVPFPFGDPDVKVSVPGLLSPQSLVEFYGDWHVTAVLGNASDPVSDGHYLRMTMAQGSPYIYCEKKGLSDHINIQTVTGSKLWYENKNMAVFTLPNDNQTYAVFGPPGSHFSYSFTDPINRLFSGSISLHFSDNAVEQYFSVAALPYQLIGSLIYARPEVGFANNLQSDGLTLFEIPFYIPGSDTASITANLKNMFFGQFGGIIKGVLSDAVTFPPSTSDSAFYKALYDFTNSGSPDYPLFQAIQIFEQHAFAFPVDTKIDWKYNQSDAEVGSTYNITTSLKYSGLGVTVSDYSSDTLIALKPHQHKYLENSDQLLGPNHVYTSARGELRLMQGRSFETVYDYTGFVPSFPDVFSSSEKDQLNTYFGLISDSFIAGNPAIENPPAAVNAAQGTYATGKVLGRFAQMMPALTMTGQSDLKAEIIGYMRAVLTNWFDPTDEIIDIEPATPAGKLIDAVQSLQSASDTSVRYFYYDQKWDTLIGYPADFGAGMELNDHHFHYGYFIHAMAYILLYGDSSDQAWALSHKPIVDMMIKDCANWDRSDSMFPFLRFFNAFNGHFYASGWALGSGNQESTAEAMNFAAGTLLWGYVTQDKAIKDLGIFLYTSQKITLQEYWFDVHQTNFPKDIFFEDTSNGTFNRYNYNRQIVSVLKSASGEFATFFGAQPVFIYGIQYLPITHASVYLGLMPQKLLAIDNDLLPATQNFLNQGIAYDSSNSTATINFAANYKMWAWADIFAEVRALYQPEQAAIDLATMGQQYKTELFIPPIFLSDFPVSPVPALLSPAVSPPFSDTPLGEAGESKAHTYYWIHGLKHLGVLQTELVANIEMAVAFGPSDDNPQNFLVYQQTPDVRTVTFRHLTSGQQYCFAISDGPKLYHFMKQDSLSDCTIAGYVNPCQIQIMGLTYPATICKSDLITIDFMLTGNNLYTNQIGYTIFGDGVSDVSGFSTTNTLISISRQAPAVLTTLSYTITAYLSDLITCSDQVNFQIATMHCTPIPSVPSHALNIFIIISLSLYGLVLLYLIFSGGSAFF